MTRVTCYAPLPLSFTHGQGVWLYDSDGNAYLDGLSGIAVSGLGHAHPDVVKTMQEQATKLIHVSNMFHIPEQVMLAEKLTALSGMEQVFFANSGAEANEAAIKLARLYGHEKGVKNPVILVMEGAFHGRTMATLTASGSQKVQAGFAPLVPGFIRVPFNDFNALKKIAANQDGIVAVMLETIQGEGGVRVADDAYLADVALFCKQQDWLLILDEVQTGNGRTGAFFSYMHSDFKPDILTTAKGLGNGIPIGACLMRDKACNLFKPGNHGSTYGGNPFACAIAHTVLTVIERDQLCDHAGEMGALLKEELMMALGECAGVLGIHGRGLMLGVLLDRPAVSIMELGLKHGVLFSVTADNVIRVLPPLIISHTEVHELVKRLSVTIREFCR